jgi:hypothetical protein
MTVQLRAEIYIDKAMQQFETSTTPTALTYLGEACYYGTFSSLDAGQVSCLHPDVIVPSHLIGHIHQLGYGYTLRHHDSE